VLPSLIAIIVRPSWRGEVRSVVTLLICCLAGAAILYLQ
jgi:hypothetical protein